MKPIATLLLLVSSMIANAQIDLIYEAPAHSSPVLVADNCVKNAIVDFNTNPTEFYLYNLDNSLFRTCELPAGITAASLWWVSYPTLSLFDCDSTNVEYILVQPAGMPEGTPHTWVVREDGTVLLDLPGFTFYGGAISNNAENQGGMWNDAESAVMNVIQGQYSTDPRRYYRVCGSVPSKFRVSMGDLTGIAPYDGPVREGMKLFPNPAESEIRINYELPAGAKSGVLRVFDLQGKMVKEWNVTSQFDHIVFDVSSLQSGTYIAHLLLNNGSKVSEKFVKVGM